MEAANSSERASNKVSPKIQVIGGNLETHKDIKTLKGELTPAITVFDWLCSRFSSQGRDSD